MIESSYLDGVSYSETGDMLELSDNTIYGERFLTTNFLDILINSSDILQLSENDEYMFSDKYLSEVSNIYLCKPNRVPVCCINGLRSETVSITSNLNDLWTISFDVDRYVEIDGVQVESSGYSKIHAFMEVYVENVGYFQIQEPTINVDSDVEYLTVSGESIDKEFLDKDLVGFRVNMGTEDSLEMLTDNNVSNAGIRINPIIFYNETNSQLSLIDLAISQMPGWTVGYIDSSLKDKIFNFDIDNKNIYAFLTQDVSSSAECIFFFDTISRQINAYAVDNLGSDTNVFISYRNLLDNVNITCDADSIYTRLNVRGADDINLLSVNFGEYKIFNIDHFVNTDYMTSDLVTKYNAWKAYREGLIDDYILLSKNYTTAYEKADEFFYRVPNDGCNTYQWTESNLDELNDSLAYYNAELTKMQISVDSSPEFDSGGNYIPWMVGGNVDHASYLALLLSENLGYYTYYAILNTIIPNIEIAISNIGIAEESKTPYIIDWETDWTLYGVQELQSREASYIEQLTVLKNIVIVDVNEDAILYADLTSLQKETKGVNETTYDDYCSTYTSIKDNLDNLRTALTTRLSEYNTAKTEANGYSDDMLAMRQDVSMDNVTFGFTDDEKIVINTLFRDTDYINENILITSLNTSLEAIDISYDLYLDAHEKLSILSQPQYSFSCTLANLLQIPEFYEWKNNFKIGNFIYLEINDGYNVNLRIKSITWNPCDFSQDISVSFTNMITSYGKRNDFTTLFNNTIKEQNNEISYVSANSNSNGVAITAELIQSIAKSMQIKNVNTTLSDGQTTDTEVRIQDVIVDTLKANKITAEVIDVVVANINQLFAEDITFDGTITGGTTAGGGIIKSYDYAEDIDGDISAGMMIDLVNKYLRLYTYDGFFGGQRLQYQDGQMKISNTDKTSRIEFGNCVETEYGEPYRVFNGIHLAGTSELNVTGFNVLSYIEDSGYIDVDLTVEDNFELYDTPSSCQYRKIGKEVEIVGEITPTSTITGSSTEYTIFTLPEEFRPSAIRTLVCHGSVRHIWLLRVNTDGTVTFSRYRVVDSYVDCTPSTWLPFHIKFNVL